MDLPTQGAYPGAPEHVFRFSKNPWLIVLYMEALWPGNTRTSIQIGDTMKLILTVVFIFVFDTWLTVDLSVRTQRKKTFKIR